MLALLVAASTLLPAIDQTILPTLISPVGGRYTIVVDNPDKKAFDGRLVMKTDRARLIVPLSLEEGDLSATKHLFPIPGIFPSEQVTLTVQVKRSGDWTDVASTTRRILDYDEFSNVDPNLPIESAGYTLRLQGASQTGNKVSVVSAPKGIAGASNKTRALKIEFDLSPSSSISLNTIGTRARVLPAKPDEVAMWVYGDMQVPRLSVEVMDNDGKLNEVLGADAGWEGWKYLRFPFRNPEPNVKPPNYPMRLTSTLVLSNTASEEKRGTIYVTGIFVTGE